MKATRSRKTRANFELVGASARQRLVLALLLERLLLELEPKISLRSSDIAAKVPPENSNHMTYSEVPNKRYFKSKYSLKLNAKL